MVPASDHGHKGSRRWFCLGLVVAACLGQAGCARLAEFRKPANPAFGTETTSRDADGKTIPAGRDLYADAVGHSKADADAPPRAELATIHQERDSDAVATTARAAETLRRADLASRRVEPRRSDSEGAPAVALQTPVTLPAFMPESGEATPVANRTASGWQAETRSRAAMTLVTREPAAERGTVAATSVGPTLESLLAQCRQKLDGMSTYQVKMNHQERVDAVLNPAEDVVLSIRRSPKAVRIEWQEGLHQGREVLYAADANNGLMHVRMGDALLSLPRLSMAPDSPLAMKNGRHPITEAGFDTVIRHMEEGLKKQKAGDPSGGKLTYGGLVKPEGIDKPCHKITRVTPAGEAWLVYLDPDSSLPVFVRETAANGELLERYVFHGLKPNVAELTKAEAFDPDTRWGPAKSLLQRLARSATAGDDATKTR
jgi:Protein of unknown function (DUF1571)